MTTPLIPDAPVGQFAQQLARVALTRRIPYSGSIELTYRCNLNCVHCYANLPSGDGDALSRELSTAQWQRLLDEAIDQGLLWLTITGGEPLLRRDFAELYLHVKRRGVLPTLFTNGTLITPQIADLLVEWPPVAVEITLYGRSAATSSAVTRAPGALERTLQGIALLRERQVPVKLKTMVLTLNQHELWHIKSFVEQELGLPFRFDAVIHPRREDHGAGPLEYRLDAAAIAALEYADAERVAELQDYCQVQGRRVPRDERYVCGAGRTTFHIDPYGQLSVCLLSSQERYDLLAGSFAEGWFDWMPPLLARRSQAASVCSDCRLRVVCQNCPAKSEVMVGALETAPVRFLCELGESRSAYLVGDARPALKMGGE